MHLQLSFVLAVAVAEGEEAGVGGQEYKNKKPISQEYKDKKPVSQEYKHKKPLSPEYKHKRPISPEYKYVSRLRQMTLGAPLF